MSLAMHKQKKKKKEGEEGEKKKKKQNQKQIAAVLCPNFLATLNISQHSASTR